MKFYFNIRKFDTSFVSSFLPSFFFSSFYFNLFRKQEEYFSRTTHKIKMVTSGFKKEFIHNIVEFLTFITIICTYVIEDIQ